MECQLRKWRAEDTANLAAALNNRNILKNLRDGLPYPYTKKDADDFIAAMLGADADETYAFAIAVEDNVIGSIGAFRKDNIHRCTAEMGYYIAEPFWGKGLGTSAIQLMCRYLFGHTDLIRIFAEPFAYNLASCRILEKNGFICEGTLRSNAVKDGKILDMRMYSLLKGDFNGA